MQKTLSHKLKFNTVELTFKTEKITIWQVHVQYQDKIVIIHTTKEHPFYTIGSGFMPCFMLTNNMQLILANGTIATVKSAQEIKCSQRDVYNFTVQNHHSYFVGSSGVWVHNPSCKEQVSKTRRHAQNSELTQYQWQEMSDTSPQHSVLFNLPADDFTHILGYLEARDLRMLFSTTHFWFRNGNFTEHYMLSNAYLRRTREVNIRPTSVREIYMRLQHENKYSKYLQAGGTTHAIVQEQLEIGPMRAATLQENNLKFALSTLYPDIHFDHVSIEVNDMQGYSLLITPPAKDLYFNLQQDFNL